MLTCVHIGRDLGGLAGRMQTDSQQATLPTTTKWPMSQMRPWTVPSVFRTQCSAPAAQQLPVCRVTEMRSGYDYTSPGLQTHDVRHRTCRPPGPRALAGVCEASVDLPRIRIEDVERAIKDVVSIPHLSVTGRADLVQDILCEFALRELGMSHDNDYLRLECHRVHSPHCPQEFIALLKRIPRIISKETNERLQQLHKQRKAEQSKNTGLLSQVAKALCETRADSNAKSDKVTTKSSLWLDIAIIIMGVAAVWAKRQAHPTSPKDIGQGDPGTVQGPLFS